MALFNAPKLLNTMSRLPISPKKDIKPRLFSGIIISPKETW
jgi:hypothetical protein